MDEKVYGFRLDSEELEYFEKAKPQNISMSAWLKKMALDGVKNNLGETEDRELFEKRIFKQVNSQIQEQRDIAKIMENKVKRIEEKVSILLENENTFKDDVFKILDDLRISLLNSILKSINSQIVPLVESAIQDALSTFVSTEEQRGSPENANVQISSNIDEKLRKLANAILHIAESGVVRDALSFDVPDLKEIRDLK